MKYLLINKDIIYNGQDQYTLEQIGHISTNMSSLYIICGPGQYTQTRINIALSKAVKIYGIQTYGINILLDFMTLFSPRALYKTNSFCYIYDGEKIHNKPYNTIDLDHYKDYAQNVDCEKPNYVDISHKNIYKYLEKIPLKCPYQFYVDQFEKTL